LNKKSVTLQLVVVVAAVSVSGTGEHPEMAQSRGSRERRSPLLRGDFVVEPPIRKTKRAAPSPAPKDAPLPSQWPAKKQKHQHATGAVAAIDNDTLMRELKRRGLLAPEVFVRTTRWSAQEDVLLEQAVNANGLLFLSETKSVWHVVAKHMGNRSHTACRKRWMAMHPFWSPAIDCTVGSGAPFGNRADPVEHFHLDTLLLAHPADEHYGLMALETFTDTAPDATAEGECVDRRRITTDKMLASYNIRGVHGNGHVAFAFPKRPPGKWDVRLEAEHTLGLHQQRVTSVFLDIRIAQGRTGSA
jgi:hypothetical protein